MVIQVTNTKTGAVANYASHADVLHFFDLGANPGDYTVTDDAVAAVNAPAVQAQVAIETLIDGVPPTASTGPLIAN